MRDYETLGKQSTPEAREAAVRLIIALTFGVDWEEPRAVSYFEPGCERLNVFADDDAWAKVGAEVGIADFPTMEAVPGLFWPAIEAFREHFPMNETSNGRKYWLEVMRRGRLAYNTTWGEGV